MLPQQVHEASGSMAASTMFKAPVQLPSGATFDDYLAMQLPEDEVAELSADWSEGPVPVHQQHAAAADLRGKASLS
jgi:hypothetical protein